jgi:hypothetical protein
MAQMKSWKKVLKKVDTPGSQEIYEQFMSEAKTMYLIISKQDKNE